MRDLNKEGRAIKSDDDYVRPELPSARDYENEDNKDNKEEDEDYRRDDRFDMRRGQFSRDDEHLRILSILYYVFGGLRAFGGLFPLIYVALGVAFVSGAMGPAVKGGAVPLLLSLAGSSSSSAAYLACWFGRWPHVRFSPPITFQRNDAISSASSLPAYAAVGSARYDPRRFHHRGVGPPWCERIVRQLPNGNAYSGTP